MSIRHRWLAVAAFCPLLFQMPAQAAGAESTFALGTRLGLTTGLGMEATYGLNRWIDLRGAVNLGYVQFDYDEEQTTYRGELNYRAYAGFVDIKPFAGGFRITAGAYSRPMKLDLEASGVEEYGLGDGTYFGDLDLDGGVDLGEVAPYLGIGWGGTTNGRGFGVSSDIGVQFTQSPDAQLDVGGRVCATEEDVECDFGGANGFDVNDPGDPRAQAFRNDLAREIDDLEDDAKDFKLIPVITFGIHYRFGGGSR